jgi:hypothetical protein
MGKVPFALSPRFKPMLQVILKPDLLPQSAVKSKAGTRKKLIQIIHYKRMEIPLHTPAFSPMLLF